MIRLGDLAGDMLGVCSTGKDSETWRFGDWARVVLRACSMEYGVSRKTRELATWRTRRVVFDAGIGQKGLVLSAYAVIQVRVQALDFLINLDEFG